MKALTGVIGGMVVALLIVVGAASAQTPQPQAAVDGRGARACDRVGMTHAVNLLTASTQASLAWVGGEHRHHFAENRLWLPPAVPAASLPTQGLASAPRRARLELLGCRPGVRLTRDS